MRIVSRYPIGAVKAEWDRVNTRLNGGMLIVGNSYRDLEVWKLSIDLVEAVYLATKGLPREELYGLANQLRRAAVSVPSNIAEGQGRVTDKEFHHFLGQARGSLMELETQLIIAGRLGYLDGQRQEELLTLCGRIKSMLYKLMLSVSEDSPTRPHRASEKVRRVSAGDGGQGTGDD